MNSAASVDTRRSPFLFGLQSTLEDLPPMTRDTPTWNSSMNCPMGGDHRAGSCGQLSLGSRPRPQSRRAGRGRMRKLQGARPGRHALRGEARSSCRDALCGNRFIRRIVCNKRLPGYSHGRNASRRSRAPNTLKAGRRERPMTELPGRTSTFRCRLHLSSTSL